jgi:quercetin dioxygenase-like cupin family protein
MKAVIMFSILFLTAAVCGNFVYAQEAEKVAPDKVKVLLDNDKVKVLEFRVKPGEKTGMHSHPGEYILYTLTGGTMKTTLEDGDASDRTTKPGETSWNKAVIHDNENIETEIVHCYRN